MELVWLMGPNVRIHSHLDFGQSLAKGSRSYEGLMQYLLSYARPAPRSIGGHSMQLASGQLRLLSLMNISMVEGNR